MNENYKKVLEECAYMIEHDYAPCGLEEDIKKRLLDLTLELEKLGKIDKEGKGVRIISKGVHWAVGSAKKKAEETGKPQCYYLNDFSKKLRNYCLAFRGGRK